MEIMSQSFPNFDDSYVAYMFLGYSYLDHGLLTPNEGINQRYLKKWADMADKICFGRT